MYIVIYNMYLRGIAKYEHRYKSRVARWYILKPKIPIWVKFGGLSM
jgi:hypothetical protein